MSERSIEADSSAAVAVLLRLPITKLRERLDQAIMACGVVQGGCRFRPDLCGHLGGFLFGCCELVSDSHEFAESNAVTIDVIAGQVIRMLRIGDSVIAHPDPFLLRQALIERFCKVVSLLVESLNLLL